MTAVRVANVPEDQFEQAVESDEPSTVTALAEMGKQSRAPSAPVETSTAPGGFKPATYLIGRVKDFAAFCERYFAPQASIAPRRSKIDHAIIFAPIVALPSRGTRAERAIGTHVERAVGRH